MSSNENEFQFELREKLYFNEGELVEELVNISLDPEINIDPSDTYISIHGEIELRGEYKKAADLPDEEELPVDFDHFEAKRFVRSIATEEVGLMEFTHQFPVEISVPSYRIETIDAIKVEITDFDYELPSNNQLNVTASAIIYGIKEDVNLLQDKNKQEASSRTVETEQPNFEFEIKFQEKKREEQPEEPEKLERTVYDHANSSMEVRVAEEAGWEEEDHHLENKENQREEAVQDVSYLSDMFYGEEEENYAKMRICIVQEEDTIETVAERFDVSTLQLIKQNELEDNYEINEGQLLYIPKK